MSKSPIYDHIVLDDQSATPKYQQLVNCIINGVQMGYIKKDDILPSLNDLSIEFEISRDTAERGYKHLKDLGVIASVPGKGYFIKNTEISQPLRVFLLFNKLSPHKKIIYDSFVAALDQQAAIDFYIYDNNFSFFKKLLSSKKDGYTHYVIIPHFLEGGENAHEVINLIDKNKLILVDKLQPEVTGTFGAVYENFEKDIFEALNQALPQLSKYHTIKIIFPEYSYFPKEILKGFSNFCVAYAFNHKVVHNILDEPINAGEVFINLMEDDLVRLIEKIITTHLVVGKDVGVISYNETPVKKVILDGITTISTDFKMIGEKAAELILTNSRAQIEVPFYLNLRPSL
ncbi:DNA-binding transcriptional regulator YhcF, GntR family [Chryseolinea serpens]|uniref:DNA-binding transcriptional regulator YhcF, GntR family n=1 Tax=Chryseolinea serpens TaxID=947013 RepID=A0A1M5TC70_9BACT|nr:GntR family transcriptional regulator [Chryseolinea serpens]SHH48377.1 DNA-binding transcriptional regulator YhcF, GntR family [Chryseolinea serpens]